jgi:hypothetical protein
MQVVEFSKGDSYALAISVAPDSADAFMDELRNIKAALLGWKAERQEKCGMVMLTVVSQPEHHTAIESLIDSVYREEADLAPLLQSLHVDVAMLNPRGKPVKEFRLGQPTTRRQERQGRGGNSGSTNVGHAF